MKPDKTGHPLYTTSPDCNGLFTGSVWLGLVFFRATGKNQSLSVGSGQNQSEPDAEKQTCDRLVRPDFMYQTLGKMSLVLIFGLCGVVAMSPQRRPLSRARRRYGRMVALGGKARDRANVGLTYTGKCDTPSKRRTVRKLEGVSPIMAVAVCF